MKKNIILFLICASVCACSGGGKKAEVFKAHPFPGIQVPSLMTEESEVVEYLVLHYWDNFASVEKTFPCDSAMINGVAQGDVEQAFANWTAILERTSLRRVQNGFDRFYDKIVACEKADSSSNVFEAMSDIMGRYLYDPNSPLRNEDWYRCFAIHMAGCNLLDEAVRGRYAYEAQMCALNAVGTPAADFAFSDRQGKVRNLYSVQADYTLLFFSNPGCKACMEIIDALKNPLVEGLIAQGRLAVVNVYIDEAVDEWLSYMPIYPENWYNGYDHNRSIRTDLLYNIRAIPSLYVLNAQKKVIMKDAPSEKVFAYLEKINNNQ